MTTGMHAQSARSSAAGTLAEGASCCIVVQPSAHRHDSYVVFRDEWVARSAPSKQARLTSERAKYKVRIFLGLSIIFPSGKRSISVKLAPPNDEHA